MELIEKPVTSERKAKIKFEYDIEPPLDILSVKDLDITVGSGEIGSFIDAKRLIPAVKTYAPDPANKAVYDRQFAVYKTLYKANKAGFAALNG